MLIVAAAAALTVGLLGQRGSLAGPLFTGGKAVGVETNEGRYNCGALVLAAGPWAAALATWS